MRLLQALASFDDVETYLVVSEGAKMTIRSENAGALEEYEALADRVFDSHDLAACISSGSYKTDGMIVASPVYYASPNGSVLALLDRLFMSANCDLRMKVGASFAVARRAGTVATFDVLNKYYTINQMPVASGRYWNNGFGRAKGEIEGDEEGLQNARIVAKNMLFLMRSIALGKEKYGLPDPEPVKRTSFI